MKAPTLLLWGDSDRIVDPEYGRAYAAAIPTARFQLLGATGHLPQLETPGQLLQVVWTCAETDFSSSPPPQLGARITRIW
jgi:pimeloyl-ACP methyl ester carboxylesterase